MRALVGISSLLLLLACGDDGKTYSAECEALWPTADACWREYCQLDGGNRLFCSCLSDQQSLDGETCGCSGLARDSFLDGCSAQEKPYFDCATDKKRIADLEAKWKCCLDSSDCGGGTCGDDHRCQ